MDQYFWLGETLGNSNLSLTLSWKNPKILKLIHFVTLAISRGLHKSQGPKIKNAQNQILLRQENTPS